MESPLLISRVMPYTMLGAWLKSYLPMSLYGRAALILLVPLVTLQLVVSIVFIQRHYEGVTEQMTRSVVRELTYLLDIINEAPDPLSALADVENMATALDFELVLPSTLPDQDQLGMFDFSGRRMIKTMRSELPQSLHFDMTVNRKALVWISTQHGALSAMFERRRVSASNPHQLLVLMVFAGLVLTVIAIVFLRNQLRPIRRLARASEAFGKGRSVSYYVSGATEVRAAGQAFLDMRARIERQIEQRTMMLSGISHDLRTPLTRLKLGLSLQEQDSETAAMLRDVDDMERLVEEFLAFARGDKLEDPETVDPLKLAQDVTARFEDAGQAVELGDLSGEGRATLHPLAVARALENLIGNAIKYGNKAVVSAQVETHATLLTVEDDGPGIPAHERDEALKPFSRLVAARNQDQGGGVGLGLAIAHDIARRHGGTLELAESNALGGLRATLVLPR